MIFKCHWPAHWSLYYVGISGSRESEEVPLGQMACEILSVSVVIRFVQELEVWVPRCSFLCHPSATIAHVGGLRCLSPIS